MASKFGSVRVWWRQGLVGSVCVHVNVVKHVNKKRTQKYSADFDSNANFSLSLNTSNVQRTVETRAILSFLSRVCVLLNSSCQ